MMFSNHLIVYCPILFLPSIFPSIRVFSSESAVHIRWPKYWSFSFSISPSNEYSGLIFFMIDWFDLLAVQGTLKSILQHPSSKTSILQCSVQFSHSVMSDSLRLHGMQASLSITNSQSLFKFRSIELVMPSNHLILCHPLLLPPSTFPASGSFQMSQVFTSGGQSIGVSASTSVLPKNTQD